MDDIKRLPRTIGIMADLHYTRKVYIETLLQQTKDGSIIVVPSGNGMEELLKKYVLLNTQSYLKVWESEPFESRIFTKVREQRLVDYMFLSYLKFLKGHLFIFPHWYPDPSGGNTYSSRVRDMIINAHTIKLPYTIITAEPEKSGEPKEAEEETE